MSEKILPRENLSEIMSWIERPEVIAITGPRQAGKTTLLRMMEEKLTERGVSPERFSIFLLRTETI